MPVPHRPLLAAALAAAYGTTAWTRRAAAPPSLLASAGLFAGTLAAAYLLLCAAYGVWSFFLYPFCFSPLRHLPQPTGNVFFLGQFLRIHREPSGQPALEWINTIPNNGLIRYLGLFNQERLLVTQPKALAEVLVAKNYDFAKPALVRNTLSRVLGVGVLLAEGDEHRFQRKLLSPAFAFRHIKDLYPVFWRKGRESVVAMRRQQAEQAAQAADGAHSAHAAASVPPRWTALEVNDWASRATLDIIGVAGLGRDFAALTDPDNELVATYRRLLSPSAASRALAVLGLVLPRWLLRALPLRRNAEIDSASRFLRQTCADLIQAQKARMAARAASKADTTTTTTTPADVEVDVDILSVALESGGFTDANLADQLMTFLAAGHETTSAALTWAIYLLCVHPDVQDRLRAEIRANLPPLGDDDAADADDGADAGHAKTRDIASTDIDHLPYLHAVCSEVLRYFAPVPSTLREAVVDTTIQGQFVPRGTLITLVPWAVNKSEALWGPDARQFRPERWLRGKAAAAAGGRDEAPDGGSTGGASNYAFMTFLHGPRSCIGMHFARAEFACLLAAWIGRFEFRLQDPADLDEAHIEIRGGVSARPYRGMHVFATPLEGW